MAKGGKENLRVQILKAARKLLVKDGVQNVSMRKIAAVIGYTATSIYYHFKNKDELIHALIDEGHELMDEALRAAQEKLPAGTDALERIHVNMRNFVAWALENREYYEIMYMMHSEEFTAYPKEDYREVRKVKDLGTELYEKAVEAGMVREPNGYMATAAVGSMLHGYVSMVLMHRFDKRLDQNTILDNVIDCIMRGIVLEPQPVG